MKLATIADMLWGQKAKVRYLFMAALIMLFTCLGAREIWTQEHRWADIVSGMFFRHDFLHPYLGVHDYYDKPLLSYWLIALVTKVTGILHNLELRIPSALAGLIAIGAIYQLGTRLKNRELGLLSGWMLLTTFYFVFWARVASADMLNLAGSLLAVAWYMTKCDTARLVDYMIFFVIIAVTSLCKGLVGAIIPLIAIFVDLCLRHTWKQHLRAVVFLAMLPAVMLYVTPFLISSYVGGEHYGQNGLYLVYKENILRYFQPFDHRGPLYTYFIYLPIYLLPWGCLLLPAIYTLASRYKTLSTYSKWIILTLALLFLFFTLSGSRRSYYVLPVIPYAILFVADWMICFLSEKPRLHAIVAGTVVSSFMMLFVIIDLIPAWFYAHYGVDRFAQIVKQEAVKRGRWEDWHIIMLDAESKLDFYLHLPPNTPHWDLPGNAREMVSASQLKAAWPMISAPPSHTIFITRKRYQTFLSHYFTHYDIVELSIPTTFTFFKKHAENSPIAFIPIEQQTT